MKQIKPRQILAMGAIILILLLVLATLIFACIDTEWSSAAFRACLYAVIVVPIMAYVFAHFSKILRDYTQHDEGSQEDRDSE